MAPLVPLYGLLSVILRAAVLASQSLTIGGVQFLILVAEPSQSDLEFEKRKILQWIRRWAVVLAGVHLISLLVNVLILMGSGITLSKTIGGDFFRSGTIAIASALVIAFARHQHKQTYLLVPSVLILASSVLTSHAVSRLGGRLPLLVLTALHQAAAAAWIGGLPYLLLLLKHRSPEDAQEFCVRFSRLAQISVIVLTTAGTLLAVAYVRSLEALYGTSYGVMLCAKIALLSVLLILGFLNRRLVHVGIASSNWILARLKRFGELEIAVGFSVILAAASLTSLPPAADLGAEIVSGSEIAERLTPRWPHVDDPVYSRSLQQKIYSFLSSTLSDSSIRADAGSRLSEPTQAAWSEYNHHWAGLIVLAMGLLAFLARTGMGWAQNWPLLLLGLAVFIIYRADPENWPLGPNGFWTSFSDPEVLLHRVFAILIVAFGAFERNVQTTFTRERVGLIFPIVFSLAGALLLTHSHNLVNLKEETLAELSHTSIAVVAILAGSCRWLELRLPQEDPMRRVPAWLWPLCLLLIGMILLNYRET